MSVRESAIFLVGYIEGLLAGGDISEHVRAHMATIMESSPDMTVTIGAVSVSGPEDALHRNGVFSDQQRDEHVQKTPENERFEKKAYFKFTDDLLPRAKELYAGGMSCSAIGELLGPSGATIRTRLIDAGIKMRPSSAEACRIEKETREVAEQPAGE